MEDLSPILRIVAGAYYSLFLVILICCYFGFRGLRKRLLEIDREIRKGKPPLTFREKIIRRLPPDERREFRRRLGPYWREWRFWAFFFGLDFVLLWVFKKTLPGGPNREMPPRCGACRWAELGDASPVARGDSSVVFPQ